MKAKLAKYLLYCSAAAGLIAIGPRVVDAQAVGPASGQMTQVAPPLPPGYAPAAPPPAPAPR